MPDPNIQADINQIKAFRKGVGVSTEHSGLSGDLSSTSDKYYAKLYPAPDGAPDFGQHVGPFTEANDLAGKYPNAAAALIGKGSALENLTQHMDRLSGAADNAVDLYGKQVYSEANAAQTMKDYISNWTPPLPGL